MSRTRIKICGLTRALGPRGQQVEVHVLAYPGRVFKARITDVAAVLDPVTHRLPVRAEIDNHDAALKPEMFASFRIITSDAARYTSPAPRPMRWIAISEPFTTCPAR